MDIGIKLTLAFLTVTLLVLAIGYISTNTSQQELQKSIGESSIVLATEILHNVDRTIYYRIEEWRSYSYADSRLHEALIKSNQAFENLTNIHEYINEKDMEWASKPAEEITPFMRELMDNEVSDRLRKKVQFYEKKYGYRVIGEVSITNKYGANVAQTEKTYDY